MHIARFKPQFVVVATAAFLLISIAFRNPAAPPDTTAPKVAFRSSSTGPIQREIVQDLSPVLVKGLKEHGLKHLLVLAGEDEMQQQLDWKAVQRSGITVAFAPTYEQLLLVWHRSIRHACVESLSARGASLLRQRNLTYALSGSTNKALVDVTSSSNDGAAAAADEPSGSGSVALLVRSQNGALRLQQTQLVTAAAHRLRHCLGLTAAYGSYSDKGDSLIFFGLGGTPLSASFLSTNVFRDKFSAIYDKQFWGSGEYNGGGSGYGSSLNFTRTIRAELPALIARYKIKSMLDSSCGSMHWMPLVLENVSSTQPDFKFMGTDVACSLVGNHSVKFAAKTNWKFECVDYANQQLPKGYELIWSRDSLQHLPLHSAWMFLNNVKASGAKYLLVGSYVRGGHNVNIPAGEYYPINLLRPPFNVGPEPLEIIDEVTEDGKHLLLFDVAKMTWQDELLGLV